MLVCVPSPILYIKYVTFGDEDENSVKILFNFLVVIIMSNISQYIPGSESFSNYLDRLNAQLTVLKVKEADKKSYLIAYIGSEAYSQLKDACLPEEPQLKSYDELVSKLEEIYSPRRLVVSERFIFNQRTQNQGESTREYITALKKLSSFCVFGSFLNDALRDRLIVGISDESCQRKLLGIESLTFEEACKIALDSELVCNQTQQMNNKSQVNFINNGKNVSRQTHSSSKSELKWNGNSGGKSWSGKSSKPGQKNGQSIQHGSQSSRSLKFGQCYRCGRKHDVRTCPAREWECFSCKLKGHTSKMCKTKIKNNLESIDLVNNVSQNSGGNPLVIKIKVNNKLIPFEVDSGASVSVMPIKYFNMYFNNSCKLEKKHIQLSSVNCEPVKVLGQTLVNVEMSNQKNIKLYLIITENSVKKVLVGRSWLDKLYSNWRSNMCLNCISSNVDCKIGKNIMNSVNNNNCVLSEIDVINNIKLKFPGVVKLNDKPADYIKDHEVNLSLKENSVPVFHRAYQVPYALKSAVEIELNRLEVEGVISKVSISDWASPIVVVPKKNNKIRICVDLKTTLNPKLQIEQHPLPRVDDVFNELSGGSVFTVLDLAEAYLQLQVAPESRKFLTINTHKGLYCFNRLCYGVASAPSIFQSVMENILRGVSKVQVYLDDIIICGSSRSECEENVNAVLERLNEYRVKVNFEKCQFYCSSVQFLGHKIDCQGVHPDGNKMDAIRNAPCPNDVVQLKSFLGLINYYQRFIPMSSSILAPLYNLTKNKIPWNWSDECRSAFENIKQVLIKSQLLVTYNPDLPLVVTCDSSSYGVGAVLSHLIDGEEKPILFASSTLSAAEKNYAQIEREGLAIIFAVKKFHKYLFARKFILVTDHLPLKSIFNPSKNIPVVASSRLQRWAVILSSYQYEIQHRKGVDISNADALSRLPQSSNTGENACSILLLENLPLTYKEVSKKTSTDEVLKEISQYTKEGWPGVKSLKSDCQQYYKRREELSLVNDCLILGNRVVIPKSLREDVLMLLHKNHPGIVRSKMLARSYVWWPNIDIDIDKFIKTCTECQCNQNDKNVSEKVYIPWENPSDSWKRIHIDFLEINQVKLLIIVDSFSKWIECFAMGSTTASKVIEVLENCFCRFGSPEIMVTDNGPPFGANEFKAYCEKNCIKLVHSPPYNPESNGLAERGVQTIKKLLIKSLCVERDVKRIQSKINNILVSYRNTPTTSTGCSPSDLIYNFKPKNHLSILKPPNIVEKNKNINVTKYEINDKVLVRNNSKGQKWLTGRIMKMLGTCSYLVRVGDKIRLMHVNKLKKSYLNDEVHPRELE
ncbi:uncharacterized protein K02A2.6-like [Metopolophium dirhodum]|uniref:uncharacterized protein K02A2.6-like n=1 Tax=Metopolophium dirhodum TaxID=44670 RepID=UPI00298FEEB3|nr:uncharacterized protein K02A2.6-like [Metopolophium dirhodum]